MAEPVTLRTVNLTRSFPSGGGEVTVLKGISLELPAQKLSVIRGPSGSGKTTLINLLGALDTPSSGEIWLEDRCISCLPERQRDELRRRELGFIFQSIALMGHMTAAENVDFRLRLAGIPYRQRRERVPQCLELVGLAGKGSHYPGELSGGEQQRVAIASALSFRPSVIFADEPTAQLDTGMALKVVGVFKELIQTQAVTIVMTTHDPDMMEIADRVYTLQDGEIVG